MAKIKGKAKPRKKTAKSDKRGPTERRGDAQDMFHGGGGGTMDDPEQQSVDADIERLLGGGREPDEY